MARFSGSTKVGAAKQSVMTSTGTTTNYEGGGAFTRDAKSDLFLFAAVNMVGQDTFYEGADERDQRFRDLVVQVTREDADWIARFIPYLRSQMNMRTASVVMAVEAAHELMQMTHRNPLGAGEVRPTVRQLVNSACLRPDEPAELLGYWWSRFGRTIPQGVKRGLADAVVRLYTEKAALKYDGISRSIRMGDVIELVHPKPKGQWQDRLFKYLLDERHHHDGVSPETLVKNDTDLSTLVARARLETIPVQDRRAYLEDHVSSDVFADAGITWEALSGWLQGPMDAKAWEAVIPSMGVMALIRNLRNFDEAGVSDQAAASVVAKLASAEDVAKSRAFPFRFFSAYLAAPSLRWGWALEQAVRHSTANIPTLGGRTLVLLDTSASMRSSVSEKSSVECVDVGAVFASALAVAGEKVDLWEFADTTQRFPLNTAQGVLKTAEALRNRIGQVGHGTETIQALKQAYDGHDRVVIVTDMQAFVDHYGYRTAWGSNRRPASINDAVPASVPMYGINPVGYSSTGLDLSQPNRLEIGGFSDKLFTMIAMLEKGKNAGWPF